MKRTTISVCSLIAVIAALFAFNPSLPSVMPLEAQGAPQVLTSTTLAAAQTATATTVTLTTSTGFTNSAGSIALPSNTAGAFLVYVDLELERVIGGSANTWTVQRGWGGTAATAHANSRRVWFGAAGQFQSSDPPWGSCTSPVKVVPWINVLEGNVWMCRSSLWAATNVKNITYASTSSQTTLSP